MKIRHRAILVIISTNFIIILLSILAGTGYMRVNFDKYIEADMLVVADIADRFISSELDRLKYEAQAVSAGLSAAASPQWPAVLKEKTSQYPHFIGMAVLDKNAGIPVSAGERPAPAALMEHEAIQKAFSGQSAFTSTIAADQAEADQSVRFYLACPIPGVNSQILVLTLDGMFFSELVSAYHVWDTGHIFIDDSDGYVIANIRPEWVQNRQNFILQAKTDPQYEEIGSLIQKLTAGGRGIDYYEIAGVPRVCAYRPISGSAEGWCLGIVAPLSESPVKNVDRGLMIVALISFLLNVAAAVIASNFIKKPFEELAGLRTAAEASSQAKTDFLANMSHEIRTPLNAVVGLSELALDSGELKGDMQDKLEKIHASGMTILSMVNDILDISKIESGKFEIYPVHYDTPSLINDIVTLNVVRIGEKPVSFQLSIDESLPVELLGDDLRVKQIFNNLLSNAFKYTNAGSVQWRLSFERDSDDIWLVSSIKDTGIGIRPEAIPKLFLDYHQADAKTNRKVEGTGLGLAITKRLVDMMEGSLRVESEYGQGSTFHVRLRQAFVSETPIGKDVAGNLMSLRYTLAKRSSHTKLPRVNLSYAHILVVDDILTNLDVVKGMMKPYQAQIACATSGQQAIDLIRAGRPRYSAVFMDHMMPGMDGVEAVRIIREEIGTDYARQIPIIALTANAIVGNEEMFLRKGFQDFISKPIDMAKLDAVLRRWVRDKAMKEYQGEPAKEDHGEPANIQAQPGTLTIGSLDIAKALERFSGDEDVLSDVLRSYLNGTRPLLGSLSAYLANGKLDDYAITVHGIKGSSYGICAMKAGEAAAQLEHAAKAGSLDAVRAGHPAFVQLMEGLLRDIKAALAGKAS